MAKDEQNVNLSQVDSANDGVPDDRLFTNRGSMSIIGCRPARVWDPTEQVKLAEQGGLLEMADIIGQIRGITEVKKLKDAQTGVERDSWGLVGEIEAINLELGTIYHFPVFYFPSGFHEAFVTEIKAQLAQTPDNAMIEFGWRMYARKQPTSFNANGYAWTAKPFVTARRHDPLASLRQRMLAVSRQPIALPGQRAAQSPAV